MTKSSRPSRLPKFKPGQNLRPRSSPRLPSVIWTACQIISYRAVEVHRPLFDDLALTITLTGQSTPLILRSRSVCATIFIHSNVCSFLAQYRPLEIELDGVQSILIRYGDYTKLCYPCRFLMVAGLHSGSARTSGIRSASSAWRALCCSISLGSASSLFHAS